MTQEKTQIQWQALIEIIVVMMAILGSTIPLYLNNSAKIDAIQQEMKDFHTRLATQDLEFKMRLCAIEEKKSKHE